MLTIKVDTRAAERLLANVKNGLQRATRDSFNDTAKHIRAKASTDIRAKWNVKKKDLDPRLKITPATINRLEAKVEADGKPIPVIVFGARQVRQGVSVAITKGARTLIKSGFIATMKSGHTGVFLRPFKTRKQGTPYKHLPERRVKSGTWVGTVYRPQLPILERSTMAPPSMWQQIIGRHVKEAQSYLVARFASRVQRMIETGK